MFRVFNFHNCMGLQKFLAAKIFQIMVVMIVIVFHMCCAVDWDIHVFAGKIFRLKIFHLVKFLSTVFATKIVYLIFIWKVCRRKFFNKGNFLIYSIHVHVVYLCRKKMIVALFK